MWRRMGCAAAALIATLSSPDHMMAQERIRVALSVTEDTGGLFQSAFASGLRSLRDVDVVGRREPSDFELVVVVTCSVDPCSNATQYGGAVRLTSPLNPRLAVIAVLGADSVLSRVSQPHMDIIASNAQQALADYHTIHSMWSLLTGRGRIREQAAELVAQIDTKCLERFRIIRRLGNALREGQTEIATQLQRRLREPGWIC
jgi:hypothetical protein